MVDRLAALLSRFELQARVFHTGPLCQNIWFDAGEGVGHLHLLRGGVLDIETGGAGVIRVETPSMVFYPAPIGHRLIPIGDAGCDLVCATLDFGSRTRNPLIRSLPSMVVIPLADMTSLADKLDRIVARAEELRAMLAEGFGSCGNQLECEAVCPKQISADWISWMRREF